MAQARIHLSQEESHLTECNVSLHWSLRPHAGGQLARSGHMANGAAGPSQLAGSPVGLRIRRTELLGTERITHPAPRESLPDPALAHFSRAPCIHLHADAFSRLKRILTVQRRQSREIFPPTGKRSPGFLVSPLEGPELARRSWRTAVEDFP